MTTFEYDEQLLKTLFTNKIATTVFEDKLKRESTDIFAKYEFKE